MTPQDLRRKQVEEIAIDLYNCGHCGDMTPEQGTEKILSLLSDAERSGAWAVSKSVDSLEFWDCCGSQLCHTPASISRCMEAARQVAESFGPDPEGERTV